MENGDKSSILILDGGMSRELIRLGAPFHQPEWSAAALIEAPEFVKDVHTGFAEAGADIITTNTYALVPFHIGEDRFREQGERLAALAGRLAREVAEEQKKEGKQILVAGSLPPIFGSYQPELFDKTRVQDYLSVLVRALTPYVDVWLGETLSLVAEAEEVAKAIKSTGKPLWIAFTLNDEEEAAGDSVCLRSGETILDAVTAVQQLKVDVLLFNCTQPEFMSAAIRGAKKHSSENHRLGVYANSFEAKSASYAANESIASLREDLSSQKYLSFAQSWVADGASVVGGCCGIGKSHIEKLAQTLKASTS